MKDKLLPSIALGAICFVVAALLALVHSFTEERIEQNKIDEMNASLADVLPDHSGFEEVNKTADMPSSITLIKRSEQGGYVFNVVVNGKNTGMTVLIGITSDGKIAGTKCTANNETPTYAKPVFDKTEAGYYVGMTEETFKDYIVSGSTLTSKAYAKAVKDALLAFSILEGGDA